MTSVEQFSVDRGCVQPPTVPGLPATCGQISFMAQSGPVYRMLNANDAGAADPNADQELRAIFQPVSATNSINQFLVRFVDPSHQSQYLLTCPGAAKVAGIQGGVPYVAVAGCPVNGPTVQAGANCDGCLVNPVHTVRWEIVGPTGAGTTVPAQEVNALDNQSMTAGRDPNKYDLVRSFLDSATGAVIPETTEIISEFAVDMDFAFSVDTGDSTGTNPTIVPYDFGDTHNQLVADYIRPGVSGPANPDPQRIRSVRFRLATRAAQPDRTATIPTTGTGGAGAGTFAYRYCVNANGCAGNALTQWARVRTIVSEVSVPNQQQVFF
jgi:hypothetical protein